MANERHSRQERGKGGSKQPRLRFVMNH